MANSRVSCYCCLMLSASSFFFASSAVAETLKPQPTAQDVFRQRHAFDKNLKTWKAEMIRLPGDRQKTFVDDYATMVYGHPWDFAEDGDGIRKFGPGLKDVKAGDGVLSFTTSGKDNYFYWGQHNNGGTAKTARRKSRSAGRKKVAGRFR